jgi:hypothetical protein
VGVRSCSIEWRREFCQSTRKRFFCGELIRLAAIPNGLAGIGFSHWNGPAAQFDKEHRCLIVREATELRDFVIVILTPHHCWYMGLDCAILASRVIALLTAFSGQS